MWLCKILYQLSKLIVSGLVFTIQDWLFCERKTKNNHLGTFYSFASTLDKNCQDLTVIMSYLFRTSKLDLTLPFFFIGIFYWWNFQKCEFKIVLFFYWTDSLYLIVEIHRWPKRAGKLSWSEMNFLWRPYMPQNWYYHNTNWTGTIFKKPVDLLQCLQHIINIIVYSKMTANVWLILLNDLISYFKYIVTDTNYRRCVSHSGNNPHFIFISGHIRKTITIVDQWKLIFIFGCEKKTLALCFW